MPRLARKKEDTMAPIDPKLLRHIEAITQQTRDRTKLYQQLAQLIGELRIQLDQEVSNEQMATLGHQLITDRFLTWLGGGDSSNPLLDQPVTVTVGSDTFIID